MAPNGGGRSSLALALSPRESTAFDRWALTLVRDGVAGARLRFALWDGFELPCDGPPVGTLTLKTRRALLGWAWDPDLNFGEAYMSGEAEVDGDLVAVLEEAYRALRGTRARSSWWRAANDLARAKANVHSHYDLGNAFYRLWLDREMVYTCAYFPTAECSLEEAQVAKMDLVCRKLGVNAGDHVVEAGCGWGALALHMAREYGAIVRAFNVSKEQIAFARERAAREGLAGRVEFIEDDYRNMSGAFDVFVSVGMLEHVGLPDYPTFGDVIHRTLKPNGRALLHFIGRNQPKMLNAWVQKRIFPGAYPPTLAEAFLGVLEPHGFSVLDVENLRLHYALTLRHWLERFERSTRAIETMFDARFVRAWRLYLAGSQASFTTGAMQLFQVVLARGESNAIPWVRYGQDGQDRRDGREGQDGREECVGR